MDALRCHFPPPQGGIEGGRPLRSNVNRYRFIVLLCSSGLTFYRHRRDTALFMAPTPRKKKSIGVKKVRVPLRRNRSSAARTKNWTGRHRTGEEIEVAHSESVVAKGALSRQRTIIVRDDDAPAEGLRRGTVVAMRGLYAEVDSDDRIWLCTVRRVLRTRLIKDRHPVTIGDHVHFSLKQTSEGDAFEGVIEAVEPQVGVLQRRSGRRIHTIVANVDQVVIVTSAAQPRPKPHLVDRYIVSALAGNITPIVCLNKIDLDGGAAEILERWRCLGYTTLSTSAVTGEGINEFRAILKGKETGIAGQSGVGKSSLLNVVQPGLALRTADVNPQAGKGRHTTTTAELIRLDIGGYVVDTPGIRSFDLSIIGKHELEAYFVEFIDRLADCKYPDCTHTHEVDCAVKSAVESGEINPDRYESYITLFDEATF